MHPECWPSDLAEHVASCASCSQLARDLRQLEDDWRHLPMPAEADQSKAAFLQNLPALKASTFPARRRWSPAARWAAAAMILIAVGPFAWMVFSPAGANASSDIVDQLIDWNLELTAAEPGDRQRLLADREVGFRQDLQKLRLPAEERDLAEKLLENGRWMAVNNDPLEEAGRLSDIADKLAGRIDSAAKQGSLQDTQRCVSRYKKVWDEGVHNSMDRAAQMKPWEMEKRQGFEHMERRDQSHREEFEKMMERARPEIRKVLESFQKQFRRPQHGGPPFGGFKK